MKARCGVVELACGGCEVRFEIAKPSAACPACESVGPALWNRSSVELNCGGEQCGGRKTVARRWQCDDEDAICYSLGRPENLVHAMCTHSVLLLVKVSQSSEHVKAVSTTRYIKYNKRQQE